MTKFKKDQHIGKRSINKKDIIKLQKKLKVIENIIDWTIAVFVFIISIIVLLGMFYLGYYSAMEIIT